MPFQKSQRAGFSSNEKTQSEASIPMSDVRNYIKIQEVEIAVECDVWQWSRTGRHFVSMSMPIEIRGLLAIGLRHVLGVRELRRGKGTWKQVNQPA